MTVQFASVSDAGGQSFEGSCQTASSRARLTIGDGPVVRPSVAEWCRERVLASVAPASIVQARCSVPARCGDRLRPNDLSVCDLQIALGFAGGALAPNGA
jgi:hypothetical protein